MITVTINVTDATKEEKEQLQEIYKMPLNKILANNREYNITMFLQDDKVEKTLGSGFGLNKTFLSLQSHEDLAGREIIKRRK